MHRDREKDRAQGFRAEGSRVKGFGLGVQGFYRVYVCLLWGLWGWGVEFRVTLNPKTLNPKTLNP